jgi:hypothetical protein
MIRAIIHTVFTSTIKDLTEWAECTGRALNNKEQNKWFIPDKSKWSGDPLKIPEIEKAFDREKINENYRDLIKDADAIGTTGETTVLKQQLDYVAALERAYRLRHATSIRCALHNSVRREAHGHNKGVFQRVLTLVTDNLKAGSP